MHTLNLLPPGHFDSSTGEDEWDLPTVEAIAEQLGVLSGQAAHVEWAVARAIGDNELLLQLEHVPTATVRLRELTIAYGRRDWSDSDPACLVRLERVIDATQWQKTHWRDLQPGSLFYAWRWGGSVGSRGSKHVGEVFPGCSWEMLEAAWDARSIDLYERG